MVDGRSVRLFLILCRGEGLLSGVVTKVHDKICKVARTIADLEGSEEIRSEHVAEAIGYRKLDRKL